MAKVKKKAKKAKSRRGLRLGLVRRGARSQLKKVEAAIKAGKTVDKQKAAALVRQLKSVIAMADDHCPFKVQMDPLA
jgi:ribosomal protein S20